MTNDDGETFIRNIFSLSAPHIDLLSTAFSFGLSNLWRRRLVSLSGIKEGDRVLDVCTGTGETAVLLTGKVGERGFVTGIDFCEGMIAVAREKVNGRLGNISFIHADAKDIPFTAGTFDAVTAAFGMRNIPDVVPALKEIKRVLKPGGGFFCLELTRPEKEWFLKPYSIYLFKLMPLIAGCIVESPLPYRYLPSSIFSFHTPADFKDIIEECGFDRVRIFPMTFGAATIFGAVKNG